MRVLTISDLHIDYRENYLWLEGLSDYDYKGDLLILAGDICSDPKLIAEVFKKLKKVFKEVVYITGNHELWVSGGTAAGSFEKLALVNRIAQDNGIMTKPYTVGSLSIVPLYAWFDYSFGAPTKDLFNGWADYKNCSWPGDFSMSDVTGYFLSLNHTSLKIKNLNVITFSHFMPRIDIMSPFIADHMKFIYPALGTVLLDEQIKYLSPFIHIYGHSHVNARIKKDGILYLNNAYGYSHENYISRKQLLCIYEM